MSTYLGMHTDMPLYRKRHVYAPCAYTLTAKSASNRKHDNDIEILSPTGRKNE